MFWRRERSRTPGVDERLAALKRAGFQVGALDETRFRVSRGGSVAVVTVASPPDGAQIGNAGFETSGEIGLLVDGGYQKFIETPDGRRRPALASQLTTLHEFLEDLRELLGITSHYNESIGTTFARHAYDRLTDRDKGVAAREWDR